MLEHTFEGFDLCQKAVILALLKRVASIDLPEILVEVEKGIFKSDLSKLQTEIQETRYSSGQYSCPFLF